MSTQIFLKNLGFFTVFLAYYFMPIVSRLESKAEIGRMTFKFLIAVVSLFSLGAVVFFAGRNFLIPLILADSFKALSDVLLYQLVGDLFRVSSYVVGFVAVAKAATKVYIAAELLQNVLFLLLSLLMLHLYGDMKAVVIAYAISYFVYFCVVVVFFGVYLKGASSYRKGHAPNC